MSDLARHPSVRQLEQVVLQISLVSHTSAATLEPSVRDSGTDIGGNRPSGGIDNRGDREPDFPQKSAAYFERRAARCRTVGDVEALLLEARAVLVAWQRTPRPSDPTPDDPQWKRWVADSLEDSGRLAARFNVSRQYINRVRSGYRAA